jgi:hypothetical protein
MNKITRAVVAATLLMAFASSTPARAGEARTHDGFFLRLSAGAGSASASLEDASLGFPAKFKISGVAGDADIAIGGRIGNNLLLHGTLFSWAAVDPDAEVSALGQSETNQVDGTATMSAFGGGLTYYLMPSNMYFTGSIGMATLDLNDSDNHLSSDSGFAFTVGIGKEWWAGQAWGLGVAGGLTYFSAKEKDILSGVLDSNESWSGPSYALRFSATFN